MPHASSECEARCKRAKTPRRVAAACRKLCLQILQAGIQAEMCMTQPRCGRDVARTTSQVGAARLPTGRGTPFRPVISSSSSSYNRLRGGECGRDARRITSSSRSSSAFPIVAQRSASKRSLSTLFATCSRISPSERPFCVERALGGSRQTGGTHLHAISAASRPARGSGATGPPARRVPCAALAPRRAARRSPPARGRR